MRNICLALPLLLSAAALADPPEPFIPGTGLGEFRRAPRHSPCAGAGHRQFDFWVGDWKVFNRAGAFVATNRVTLELDGCVVEEHWSPIGGIRGRSLNTWDEASGAWHQTWVPAAGRPIRMDGGLRPDGVMDMTGARVRPVPGLPDWVDRYTWTPITFDRVVQAFTFDIFEWGYHQEGALTYERATDLPEVETAGSAACQAGHESGENRLLDFTTGRYLITADNGLPLARSDVAVEPTLGGCVIEESIESEKGYRATGWLYYDSVEDRFYRTVVDNQGNRLEMHGSVSANGFTLEGPAPADRGDRLRLTWLPDAAGGHRQIWEASRDAGASWRQVQTLTYAPR